MKKIVISITSYPKRIYEIHRVIRSLWEQNLKVDEIILYLSMDEFPHKQEDLPRELNNMNGIKGFRIEWVEGNLKSHKKYYYALQKYRDDIVITVDDDIEYAESLVSDLWKSYKMFPNAISARRTRMIQKEGTNLRPYYAWDNYYGECVEEQRMDLCAIGVGGVLYPPRCASDKWFDQEKMLAMSEYQDDLWLKFNELKDGIPIVYVKPTQEDSEIESGRKTALGIKNLYNGQNDKSISKLCNHMKEDWTQMYSQWIENLMTKEEYVLQKKNFYFSYIRELFGKIKGGPVYLYGAGKRAKIILRILEDAQVLSKLDAIIVSDKCQNPTEVRGIEVKEIDEVNNDDIFTVILGVGKIYKSEVEEVLRFYQCRCLELEFQGILREYENA